jgi:hypothetical protein
MRGDNRKALMEPDRTPSSWVKMPPPYPASAPRGTPIRRDFLLAVLLYTISLPLFMNLALPVYTTTQRVLAWSVFVVGAIPFFRAMSSSRRSVPLMPLIGGQYIVFYALAVFFEDSTKTLDGWIVPASSAVDMTLVCAFLSFVAIGIGYMVAGQVLRLRFQLFHFTPSSERLFWYAVLTLVAALTLQLGQGKLLGWSPGDLARPINLILSGDLAIAILACLFYQGGLGKWQKLASLVLVVVSVLDGFSGGMFQSAVQPLLIWAVCRWVIKGKAPIGALVFIAAAFFVIQPVKGTYRSTVLMSGRNFTLNEKVSLYAGLIEREWLGSGNRKSGVVEESRWSAKKRLSMLLATAHYVEWTPYPLDYRNGSTLGYMVYGLIPRAVWPDKPIAQEANKLLPADYNVQTVANQNTTMFGVGHVAEAYVNFGITGIIPLFFLLGILYRIPQLLLERRRTTATVAIFVATAVAMAGIGSSISDAFGGFLQQILLQAVLLRLFTAKRTPAAARARLAPRGGPQSWAGNPRPKRLPIARGADN